MSYLISTKFGTFPKLRDTDSHKGGYLDLARTLVEVLLAAGHSLAYDTMIGAKEASIPLRKLAVLALPSTQSDEVSSFCLAQKILGELQTDITPEEFQKVFVQLIRSTVSNYAGLFNRIGEFPHGAAEAHTARDSTEVNVSMEVEIALRTLVSIASHATSKPTETIQSSARQQQALDLLAKIALLCLAVAFNPARGATLSNTFAALIPVAVYYMKLKMAHHVASEYKHRSQLTKIYQAHRVEYQDLSQRFHNTPSEKSTLDELRRKIEAYEAIVKCNPMPDFFPETLNFGADFGSLLPPDITRGIMQIYFQTPLRYPDASLKHNVYWQSAVFCALAVEAKNICFDDIKSPVPGLLSSEQKKQLCALGNFLFGESRTLLTIPDPDGLRDQNITEALLAVIAAQEKKFPTDFKEASNDEQPPARGFFP